jgi:hypothetical protein
MIKKILGIAGILIFLFALLIVFKLQQTKNQAVARDDKQTAYGIIEGDALPCSWDVNEPERVISENKSQAILIQLVSPADASCSSVITLRAPGFDISPAKEEQGIKLAEKGMGSVSWILTPRKSGVFEIAVTDMLQTKILGISVTNVFGLNTFQARIASIIGSVFGPMMTVPWWWDRLRGRKKDKPAEEKPET